LQQENRLLGEDQELESNVQFKLPYNEVLTMWQTCMEKAYRPEALFARYEYQMRETWPNRLKRPLSRQRFSRRNVAKAFTSRTRIIWYVGIHGDYRRTFWKFALRRLVRGEIEQLLCVSLCAHHVIMLARDACAGRTNASHYSAKLRMLELETR
jgi:hypothetical protein